MAGLPDARPRDPDRVPLVRQRPRVLRRGVDGGRRAAFRRGPGGRVLELLGARTASAPPTPSIARPRSLRSVSRFALLASPSISARVADAPPMIERIRARP